MFKNKVTPFLLIYILIILVELYAVFTANESLEIVAKPFLTVLLIIMYLWLTNKINYWYVLILFLSLISDVLFIYRGDKQYLTTAIGILIIIHLTYIKIITTFLKHISIKKILINQTLSLLILSLLLFVVTPFLKDFKAIIFLHVFFLLVVMNLSFMNYLQRDSTENGNLLISMSLFILADCLFAIYKFLEPLLGYLLLVTLLYAVAQFIICRVMIKKSYTINDN